ncbi:MAG: DUF1059 domain-containing protein [Promethearchaeota archaeon]
MDGSLMYIFRCIDCGNDCDWEEIGDSKSELMIYIKEHFEGDHKMKKFSEKFEREMKRLIEIYDEDDDDF